MPVDFAAVAQHGIGRGDFVALVFSGSVEALGEVIGHATWATARKFALPDPRLAPERDLALQPWCPFPRWAPPTIRPTPGVCFVFDDAAHPAIAELRMRDGVEWEHFVSLDRLTTDELLDRRIARFLADVRGKDASSGALIGLLGYGDQGERVARVLERSGVAPGGVLVVDSRPERGVAAHARGHEVVELNDARLRRTGSAIISSPKNRPSAFGGMVCVARAASNAVLDLSRPWDDRPEFRKRDSAPDLWMTGAADRAMRLDGPRLAAREQGLHLIAGIVRQDLRRVAGHVVEHMQSGQRADLREPVDLMERSPCDRVPAHYLGCVGVFIGLDGQSNQHDAALGVFAARAFLMRRWPEQARLLIPSEHRAALGATPFECVLARSVTGRTLGAPYLTPIEQTSLGVLARAFASDVPIVEIGSALGGSAVLMAVATAREDGGGPVIISVDPDQETRPAMRAVCELEGCALRLKMIAKTSDDAVTDVHAELNHRRDACATRTGSGAGLIFIDGLHTHEQSRRDFENYAPLVRPGGIVIFHDFDARFAGVTRTVTEIAAVDERFTPLCIMDTMAVFQRRQ